MGGIDDSRFAFGRHVLLLGDAGMDQRGGAGRAHGKGRGLFRR